MAGDKDGPPSGIGPPIAQTAAEPGVNAEITERAAVRYKDGYRVAGFIVGMGTALKVLGATVGAGIFLLSLIAGADNRMVGPAAGISGFFIGGMVFALGFIAGVIVSAQGQQLKASLDGAVHSSPFLDIQTKAQVMGLAGATQGGGTGTQSLEERRARIAEVQKNWPGYK